METRAELVGREAAVPGVTREEGVRLAGVGQPPGPLERPAIPAAYGANDHRLAEIKASYDPSDLFRLNQNTTPAR